jgi:hypothetical protein
VAVYFKMCTFRLGDVFIVHEGLRQLRSLVVNALNEQSRVADKGGPLVLDSTAALL